MESVIAVLRQRGALEDDRCPECRTREWSIDFIAIPATPLVAHSRPAFLGPGVPTLPSTGARYVFEVAPSTGPVPSAVIPAVSFMCKNCGYMKFHNLRALGLTYR